MRSCGGGEIERRGWRRDRATRSEARSSDEIERRDAAIHERHDPRAARCCDRRLAWCDRPTGAQSVVVGMELDLRTGLSLSLSLYLSLCVILEMF